jgi:hypothetical protein
MILDLKPKYSFDMSVRLQEIINNQFLPTETHTQEYHVDTFSVSSSGENKNKHITEQWHEKLSKGNSQHGVVPFLKELNISVLLQNNSQQGQEIFKECILLCISTIYELYFPVKHNDIPINSLTFHCA